MLTSHLEAQFNEYWTKLTSIEKESLLIVARNYVQSKENNGNVDIAQYNKEIDEAMKLMDEGKFYSHEDVSQISKTWVSEK